MGNTSTTQQSSSSTNDPWSVQSPYLQQAFTGASNALTQAQGTTAPTGFTAQYTPDQLALFQKMVGSGSDTSLASSTGAAGTALNSAGANAATNGLYGMTNFTPQGGTASNIAAATQYANNPAISGQVDAAMRDANRNATENVLPQINRSAAASGNTNSNRPDLASGVVQRGLNDQAGDISANLRGAAYTQGLGLAEQNSEAANSNQLDQLKSLISGGTSAVGTGAAANTAAVGQTGGLYDIANSGIAGQNTASQADLTNQNQAWQFGTDSPFAALNNFYNVVGSNSWGGSSTGTGSTSSTPSFFSTLGGLMGAGGSLAKGAAAFA